MIGILILLSMATAVLLFVQYSTASVGNRELNTTLSLLLMLLSFLIGVFCCKTEPQAIDVYRGKTKLQVTQTIKDSKVIKSDTTVVFK